MDIVVVMDGPETVDPGTDTSFGLMLAARERDHTVWHCTGSEAARELDDPWRLVHEHGTAHSDLHETVAHVLDLSARSRRPSDPRLADAVVTWSGRTCPARPDDVGDWVLGAAEPTGSEAAVRGDFFH